MAPTHDFGKLSELSGGKEVHLPPTVAPERAVDAFAAAHPEVGAKVGDVQRRPDGGFLQEFTNATVYGLVEVHEVHGAIRDTYRGIGGPDSFLGYPTTDETANP